MSSTERLHSLDAARGFALLLGVVLHATMSFFLFIPAQDSSRSTTLAVTFYVIHIFRMTLFFVIAGFFAHMVFHRRGARAFIRDRAKRIVVPMAAGWMILAPATIAAVIWGLSRTFPAGPPPGAEGLAPQGFPLTHLWFLYYLCIFYVLALTVSSGIAALDGGGILKKRLDAVVSTTISRHLAPIALAVPTFAVFSLDTSWKVWFGISTPDTGLAPKLPAIVAFGTAFAFGWLLHRQAEKLALFERRWRSSLAIAAGLTLASLFIVGRTPSLDAPTVIEGGAAMRLLYAACYALSIWYWTFGLIGAAMRFCSAPSALRRYLADSSYFLYLAHVPIVFALQVLLMDLPLHWAAKFPLIITITLTVLLVSYHYLVRPTLIGEVLNGRKYGLRGPRTPVRVSNPEQSGGVAFEGDLPAPIARLAGVTKRYGKALALDEVSLAVRPGELFALLGPNGAGKTTAIGLWLGTLEPDRGSASLMGGSPLDVHSRLGVGVMMQEVALAPTLTAREHIALTASYYREPLDPDSVIELAGIGSIANKHYGKLSAGEKRQVQFATAVCGRPRLLFLDEPTVGLDIDARESMWRNLRRLLSEGCSIVLTTHYLEEAEALADRVAVLARGRVIAEGSVDEVRSLVTRTHISCRSILEVDDIMGWPGVVEAERRDHLVLVTANDTETVVRRLLAEDGGLRQLEVRQASLAEAFSELTKEAA